MNYYRQNQIATTLGGNPSTYYATQELKRKASEKGYRAIEAIAQAKARAVTA